MKYWLNRIIVTVSLIGAASASWALHHHSMMPTFSAQTSNGKTLQFPQAGEKHIVVFEWTNHDCPYVQKFYHAGVMQKLQAQYTKKDVLWYRVISSAPGKQGYVSPAQANAIAKQQGVSVTATLLDPSGKIGKLFGAKTTPQFFIYNNNHLVYQGAIDSIRSTNAADIAKATNYVAAALDATLQGKPVQISKTKPYGCGVKY